jgi:AraC family transcriptional regulator
MIGYSSPGRKWNDISVYCVTIHNAPGKTWHQLASEQATVAVVLEQLDGFVEPRKRINVPTPRSRYDVGHAMYLPPNSEIWGIAESTTQVRDVRMKLDGSMIENLLGDEGDRKKWNEPVLMLYDERIRQIAELIWQECHSELQGDSLYGESLTTALLACLFRTQPTEKRTSLYGLSRLQLKRTVDYMQGNLLSDLRLKELASVAGLSPSQFGRAFKSSTGTTPHRWILERRVELAQRLMRNSGMSIAIASDMAGFANASHFTKTFRSLKGVTPRAWLRDVDPTAIEVQGASMRRISTVTRPLDRYFLTRKAI